MKKNKLPKPITILILTLLTSLVWVSLSIYRAVAIKPPAAVSEKISKSLNPTLNTEAIQKIESAIFFQDSDIPKINITSPNIPTPIPTIIPTIAPISTAVPVATQSATQ